MKHGRSILQVLGLYAAASWVVLQIVDVLKQNKQGRGLHIVRDRLESFYGGEAKLVVEKKQRRFRVELLLPGRREKKIT